MRCRLCEAPLDYVFVDLGSAPPSNAYLSVEALQAPEVWFPLKVFVCRDCHLVQVDEVERHDALFSAAYAYFSSYSRSWLEHAERFVTLAAERLGLGRESFVLEVASNDGYLLQFVAARGIPCLGIEPTANTAAAARERGITTLIQFFGAQVARDLVQERGTADLIVANNVLAHVPSLNDFIAGLAIALSPRGSISVEFPHLLQLVVQGQFDTIYHEHFSYFSFHSAKRAFQRHGLRIWDVQKLATHGGSLRLWVCHAAAPFAETPEVAGLLAEEAGAGMDNIDWYLGFQSVADGIKNDFLGFLLDCKRRGKRVAGYGAAAKGNTLLNYAGVRPDLLSFVADASPHKQNKYLPGSRIPVVEEARIREVRPDYLVILPWNLRAEIESQLAYVREWGCRFVMPIPSLIIS